MLEDLETLAPAGTARTRPCAITIWLSTLSKKDQKIANAAMENREYTAPQLYEYFSSKGCKIQNAQTVTRHRNRVCCKDRG